MITGKDLIERGWPQGRIVGLALSAASDLRETGMEESDILDALEKVREDSPTTTHLSLGPLAEEWKKLKAPDEKWCSGSKHWTKVENFGVNRAQRDGLQNMCRVCRKAYYTKNKKKIAAQRVKRYVLHREKIIASVKRRYEENREQKAEYDRRYYQKHKKRKQAYLNEWRRNNRDKLNANKSRRRATKLGSKERHTAEEFRDRCDLYNNMCLACGESGRELTRDHITPLSLGGSDGIDNIQPLCRSCNSWKGLKTIDFRED